MPRGFQNELNHFKALKQVKSQWCVLALVRNGTFDEFLDPVMHSRPVSALPIDPLTAWAEKEILVLLEHVFGHAIR